MSVFGVHVLVCQRVSATVCAGVNVSVSVSVSVCQCQCANISVYIRLSADQCRWVIVNALIDRVCNGCTMAV